MPTETKTPKQTLVEEGTEFKGTLKSSCPVVINGSIDGEVDAPEITVARAGTVAGSLRATKLRSQGTLSGKVEATDVYLSGVVRSNTSIKAKRLLAALMRLGWKVKRQSGSHRTLSREGWPDVVFAFHDGEEIGPRMLARIARHTGITPEDL